MPDTNTVAALDFGIVRVRPAMQWIRRAPLRFAGIGGLVIAAFAAQTQPEVISDIPKHSKEAVAIHTVVALGILTAPSGRFRPDEPLTRAEFAQAMQRLFALKPPAVARNFPDIPSKSPQYTAVEALAPYLGWEILCPGCALRGDFLPEAPMSTLEAAVPVLNILLAQNKVVLLKGDQAEAVVKSVPDSARLRGPLLRSYAATAISAGIVSRFAIERGRLTLTRAQAATMLDHVQTKCGIDKARPRR